MSAVSPSNSAARTSEPADQAPKRITTGVRVSGAIGKQIPNPNPTIKRKCRERLFGTVLSAVGSNRYRIRLDNGCIVEAASTVLKVHASTTSLPPGAVPHQDLNQESSEVHDREELEPLPLGNDDKEQGIIEEEAPNRHSLWLIEDESMSAWVPRTTPTGGLPNISCIDRKPEPLGKPADG